MSRTRALNPVFFRHKGLFEAERSTRLPLRCAYIGLLTCCDHGDRFQWEPRRLKLKVLPYDALNFSEVLDALFQRGFIKKLRYEGKCYGLITAWSNHAREDDPLKEPSG